MPFVRANLERQSGGLQKMFMYDAGADAIATVIASGYFNDVAGEIDAGDVIVAKSGNNAAVDMLIVTSARGVTPVTTVNGT